MVCSNVQSLDIYTILKKDNSDQIVKKSKGVYNLIKKKKKKNHFANSKSW